MSAIGPHNPTTFVSADVYVGPQSAPSCSKSGSSGRVDERPVRACPRIFAAHGPHGWVRESVDFWCLGEPGSSEDEVPYDYPGDARHAAEDALIAAGLVDPDDGTVPRWRRGDPIPVWTNPMHVVDTVLKAALPHLRAFQIETQVRVGYELGRREAAAQIADRIDLEAERARARHAPHTADGYANAASIAREVTKGDPK